jgi:hypothetical protein
MPIYGDTDYGDDLYGGDPTSAKNVRNSVGTQYDIAINGVGLTLVPDKKAYDKKAAQTFSYNPRSLFKQGDGAALVAKDLYYWSRLEHSRWDGGETYDPWKPGDATDPSRRDSHYSQSLGYDTTDPYKLTHLREVYVSPSYEYIILTDTPLAYWVMGDHPASTEVYDQIGPDRTPGTPHGGLIEGLVPSPIANDPNSVMSFNGTDAIIATAGKVPFAGFSTPVNTWSVESWVNPTILPQASKLFTLIGGEFSGTVEYSTNIFPDNPYNYYKFDEVDPAHNTVLVADDDGSSNQDATRAIVGDFGYAGLVPTAVPNLGVQSQGDNVPLVVSGYVSPGAPTAFTWEFWIGQVGLYGNIFLHTLGLMTRAGQTGTQWEIKGDTRHVFFTINDQGPTPTGIGGHNGIDLGAIDTTSTYYFAVTWSAASGTYNVYKNGVLVTSWVSAINPWTNLGPVVDFQVCPNDNSYNLSKVAVYNAELSAARILSHYLSETVTPGGFGYGVGDGAGGSGKHLALYFPGGAGWVDTGYVFPAEITWYYIAMTCNGAGTVKAYVNNVLVYTGNPAIVSTSSEAEIGGSDTGSSFTKFVEAEMCQEAVYNITLTPTQILNHWNAGTGAAAFRLLTPGQNYARFIETFDGYVYINKQTTSINFTADGGQTWSLVNLPGDVTNINAMWTSGPKVYVATDQDVYLGDHTGFANIHGGNPAIPGVTAGIFYSGQLYVGIGTSLYYIDPATGLTTQLYDTKAFTINFIEAFQGKIWFGGTAGRQTKVWTWTNNTLPPSPANGVGAQLQDGTIPYGFIVQSSIVYLNTLLLGGLLCGDSTTEGQGAVYYIEPAGSFGQIAVLGPQLSALRGTGVEYGIRSLWGSQDSLWMGFNGLTGMARYNFVTGGFSTHVRTGAYAAAARVLAVAVIRGRSLFAVRDDGFVWREGNNKISEAWLEESEFQELPFIPKIIDGIEGLHSPLNIGEQTEVRISYDKGLTWVSVAENSAAGDTFLQADFVNTLANHWRTRIYSRRGGDATKAPEILNHSERFAPRNSFKHEWIIETLLPVKKRTVLGLILTDPGSKLLQQLWEAYEDGVAVEFIDRDRKVYKCLVLFFEEGRDRFTAARVQAGQLNLSPSMHIELLEVQRVS